MKLAMVPFIGFVGLVTMIGCAGTGKVIPIQLRAVTATTTEIGKTTEPLRVALGPFEDGRTHQTGLGVRTHLWGGLSYFDVPEGKPTEAVVQALTDYLTAKGWTVMKKDSNERADVVLTGKILELFVHAKSRVGFTEMTTKTRLTIQAKNVSDDSIVRMTLNGAGSEDVFWFDREDMEEVLNEVLADSFSKLVQDTIVVNRMLRLTNL